MDQISDSQRAGAERFGHGEDLPSSNPSYVGAPSSPGLSGSLLPPPASPTRLTEADARELRRREREKGVAFLLKDTGLTATVRDLPLSDRVMLRGIPSDLRKQVGGLLDQVNRLPDGTADLVASLGILEDFAALVDSICIAGFVYPLLARTETERTQIMQRWDKPREDVWLIDSLSEEEKVDYFHFVFRSRGGVKEDMARIATFPGTGVAQASDRDAV